MLEAFAVSTAVVALGEIGDKTQLLALMLAARYKRPMPIIWGILVATLVNHLGAAALGAWVAQAVPGPWLRWALGASFLAVAAWMLVPDSAEEVDGKASGRFGLFGLTVLAFFLAEMGDKTQIATVMLAARFPSLWAVVAGSTFGMMLANVPAVLLGEALVKRVPATLVHRIAAALFAGMGLWILFGPVAAL